mgnify:CR=1 FL=1
MTGTNNSVKVTRVVAIETASAFLRANADMWDAFGCEYPISDIVANLENQASKMRTAAERKRSTPTKEQRMNANIARSVADAMPANRWVSLKWIANNVQGVMTTQKAGALAKMLCADGTCKRGAFKGRPFYALVSVGVEPDADNVETC